MRGLRTRLDSPRTVLGSTRAARCRMSYSPGTFVLPIPRPRRVGCRTSARPLSHRESTFHVERHDHVARRFNLLLLVVAALLLAASLSRLGRRTDETLSALNDSSDAARPYRPIPGHRLRCATLR